MAFYADTYFVLNFIADFLLLLASGGICAVFAPKWRLILSAALGAVYAVLAAIGPEIFSHIIMWLVCAEIMLVVAYGTAKNFLRLSLVFLGVSAAFGGVLLVFGMMFGESVLYGFTGYAGMFLIVFGAAYFLFSAVFKRSGRSEIQLSEVEIFLGGKCVKLRALQDTGNSLSDPLTGRKVLVTGFEEVKGIFPDVGARLIKSMNAVEFAETMNCLNMGCKLLLIPYKAVGTQSGLLAAFKPDKTVINGKIDNTYIIALSPNSVGDGGAYTALMGAA